MLAPTIESAFLEGLLIVALILHCTVNVGGSIRLRHVDHHHFLHLDSEVLGEVATLNFMVM
jgi:hypothetical protein